MAGNVSPVAMFMTFDQIQNKKNCLPVFVCQEHLLAPFLYQTSHLSPPIQRWLWTDCSRTAGVSTGTKLVLVAIVVVQRLLQVKQGDQSLKGVKSGIAGDKSAAAGWWVGAWPVV